MDDERFFICVWGEGYVRDNQNAIIQREPFEFFSEELGYSESERGQIDSLLIGESVNISNFPLERQSVVRVL